VSRKPAARRVAPCRGINAVGASIPSARYHTLQHASLRADRTTFVVLLTPEQREARYNAQTIEIARMRNETRVNGLIMAKGGEW
jgi:hypothetical protein